MITKSCQTAIVKPTRHPPPQRRKLLVWPTATNLPSSPPVLPPVLPTPRESRPPPPKRNRFPSFQEIQGQVVSQEQAKPRRKSVAKQEKPPQNGTKPRSPTRTEVNDGDGSFTDRSTEDKRVKRARGDGWEGGGKTESSHERYLVTLLDLGAGRTPAPLSESSVESLPMDSRSEWYFRRVTCRIVAQCVSIDTKTYD